MSEPRSHGAFVTSWIGMSEPIALDLGHGTEKLLTKAQARRLLFELREAVARLDAPEVAPSVAEPCTSASASCACGDCVSLTGHWYCENGLSCDGVHRMAAIGPAHPAVTWTSADPIARTSEVPAPASSGRPGGGDPPGDEVESVNRPQEPGSSSGGAGP